MQTLHYDIIIVGSGIIGAALACMLAQQTSLSIAVLEANPENPAWQADTHHHRVSAITLASQRILQALQLWEPLRSKRVSPFKHIQVWDAASNSEFKFAHNVIAANELGFIIENNLLQSVLYDHLAQHPQITFIAPIKLAAMQQHANHIALTATDERCFQAKLAIAADGANSWLRAQTNITSNKQDYAQSAIVATVQTALAHQQTARQLFLTTGPLAFLPLLPANTCSIVWTLSTELAQEKMQLDTAPFQQTLAQAFPYLGDITSIDTRHVFPLFKQQTSHYIKPRIALVGDAAHTVHPLAGQGINIGLLDAASLAEILAKAHNDKRDFAQTTTLRRYERWRRAENLAMLAGIDLIQKFFASDNKSIQTIRTLGLNNIDRIPLLKKLFVGHAVGNKGVLPQIAK
jgi:2-octaprenylphenol hydroxylase